MSGSVPLAAFFVVLIATLLGTTRYTFSEFGEEETSSDDAFWYIRAIFEAHYKELYLADEKRPRYEGVTWWDGKMMDRESLDNISDDDMARLEPFNGLDELVDDMELNRPPVDERYFINVSIPTEYSATLDHVNDTVQKSYQLPLFIDQKIKDEAFMKEIELILRMSPKEYREYCAANLLQHSGPFTRISLTFFGLREFYGLYMVRSLSDGPFPTDTVTDPLPSCSPWFLGPSVDCVLGSPNAIVPSNLPVELFMTMDLEETALEPYQRVLII